LSVGAFVPPASEDYGGIGAPTDSGYTKIYSSKYAFAALKADGSIKGWGASNAGGAGAPTDSGYTKIYSSKYAFAALKADGSIAQWVHLRHQHMNPTPRLSHQL
jgi:hypothetical protein